MPQTILTCQNLCLGYETREVLHGLSFVLHEGEALSVLGENGAGKSTLLMALAGLLRPTHGGVALSGGVARRQIGYLPQQTPAQKDFPARVSEVVCSGFLNNLGLRAWYSKAQKARAWEVMGQLGVQELEGRSFRALSGGQQRRVLLARALCATQKLLLLDEPDAGLDPVAAADLRAAIVRLHREHGIAVVLVSHNIEYALAMADHVLHLGKTRFYGTPQDYRASPLGQRLLEQ
ncbi:MAG: ATP-binding cassette domain-containing protein [Oscillospiraceae bacterium]|jgi:zinc transport system ATP-binding protein|nr:ATP-binding cassette domain-containing protein [Oscillospiraceae bacterium]